MYALFEFDSESSIRNIMPREYKDLWDAWVKEKVLLTKIIKYGF
jgi:hypothetical protein